METAMRHFRSVKFCQESTCGWYMVSVVPFLLSSRGQPGSCPNDAPQNAAISAPHAIADFIRSFSSYKVNAAEIKKTYASRVLYAQAGGLICVR
jgi:hypothetical protein